MFYEYGSSPKDENSGNKWISWLLMAALESPALWRLDLSAPFRPRQGEWIFATFPEGAHWYNWVAQSADKLSTPQTPTSTPQPGWDRSLQTFADGSSLKLFSPPQVLSLPLLNSVGRSLGFHRFISRPVPGAGNLGPVVGVKGWAGARNKGFQDRRNRACKGLWTF